MPRNQGKNGRTGQKPCFFHLFLSPAGLLSFGLTVNLSPFVAFA